jgi:hypothetical protein
MFGVLMMRALANLQRITSAHAYRTTRSWICTPPVPNALAGMRYPTPPQTPPRSVEHHTANTALTHVLVPLGGLQREPGSHGTIAPYARRWGGGGCESGSRTAAAAALARWFHAQVAEQLRGVASGLPGAACCLLCLVLVSLIFVWLSPLILTHELELCNRCHTANETCNPFHRCSSTSGRA